MSQDQLTNKLLPATVLSGFLGVGKTTLLNQVLSNRGGLKVAVIVNDMSEVNIDAELIKSGNANLHRTEEKLVEMSNGCICCTLREDLLKEVSILAKENRFDYLLIESSGISEPLPVAQTFSFVDEDGRSLKDLVSLDSMVTLVDAKNFLNDFKSRDDLLDRDIALGEEDVRGVGDLLVDQVEFATTIIVNKIDLVNELELKEVTGVIRSLNADAKIIFSSHGQVPLTEILGTKSFDMEKAATSAAWLKELNNQHIPETEEYGISSFVFRARRPFHPERLLDFLNKKDWDNVIRSKGYMWLATRNSYGCLWSQAGTSCKLEPAGKWLVEVPEDEWPVQDEKSKQNWRNLISGQFGDRRQEFVVIAKDLVKEEMIDSLEKCLLSDDELSLGVESWKKFEDPFPEWEVTK